MGTVLGFNNGLEWHNTQRNPLGMRFKVNGRLYEYVQIKDTWDAGELVEAVTTRDVTSETDDIIDVATATAAGGDTLIAAAGTFTDEEIVGAVGMITEGGAFGTSFQVLERVSATTIRIRALANLAGRITNGKLAAATTAASKFTLLLPGKVVKGSTVTRPASGFAQRAAVAADNGKFGFVLAKGRGFGKLDVSGTDIGGMGRTLVKADDGLVVGLGTTVAIALTTFDLRVGRAISADIGDSNASDGLIMLDADCPDHFAVDLLPYLENDYNKVTIG